MGHSNNVTKFVLLGLTQDPGAQKALSLKFLLIYIVTMVGNLLIVVTVLASPSLRSPMYLFLVYLSLMDAVYSTVISPKLIIDLVCCQKRISFSACMGQLFLEHLFGGAEVFLVAMAYDHYVAICKPLHYLTIMNGLHPVVGGILDWRSCSFCGPTCLCVQPPLCDPNVIDHFMCDMYLLLELACSDTYFLGLTMVANDGATYTVVFISLLTSYGVILSFLKTHSGVGRHEALSKCGSHIMVVLLLFVPCILMYVRHVFNFPIDKFIIVAYTVISLMFSPLMYTLKNSEMRNAMKKLWCMKLAIDRLRRYLSY